MWKYVSRRVKETFERKCKVLDVRKVAWAYGASQHVHQNAPARPALQHRPLDYADDPALVCIVVPNRGECDVPYVHCEKWNRSRANNHHKNSRRRGCVVGDLLGAITWSGAIIFGWYASQLMCLHKRHAGWEKPQQRYWQMLQYPTRIVHSSLLSHFAFTSPNYPSVLSERTLLQKFAAPPPGYQKSHVPQAAVYDVSNDPEPSQPPSQESQKQNVEEAVADLVTFLGETEYRMGVKSIAAGQFRQAVAHLKLATSHNHPGATFNLGLCYEKGLGVPKNTKRAMECYQIASSMGHPKAMYNLGVFYAQGRGGLEKDYQTAKQCFLTAARLGQPEAVSALTNFRKFADLDEKKKDISPMTEMIFEQSKTELFTASAKFT